MAKHERKLRTAASTLARYLDEGIRASGMSVELVDSSAARFGGVTVRLYVYDKFYMRNSSRASLTLEVVGDDDNAYVTAIGAGGGNGSFLSFSYGAEENFVSVVEKLLDEYTQE